MKPGLVTLADLPDLAAGKNRTTIVVARLDDRLRDPRYGAFKITQADVDGWTHNLTETFGGRVAIDYDHSSDRGRGTKAAAWITGLHQDGKLVTADVEFTPRGAKSIRNGDYRYISPTFVADYTDEHGEKHGRALIGAALTNRPVLRKGMPTLSLSRDPFDGVAIPSNRKQNGLPMTKLSKNELVTLSHSTDKQEIERLVGRATPKQLRKVLAAVVARPRQRGAGSVDSVITLAQYGSAGAAYAGTTDWDPPATGPNRVPRGLDKAGHALHGLIAQRASSSGEPYFHAMADVTGIPAYRDLSDVPTTPVAQQGLDPERMALDNAARALAKSAGISWLDACSYLMTLGEAAQLQPGDGSAAAPWLDSQPLASPPRPWSDEDWQRDQRRARAAGVQVGALGPDGQDTQLKGLWQAGAEQGRDVVGEMAAELRADATATAQQHAEGMLDQARAGEDDRRSQAINDELTRRARNRVADGGHAAGRQLPGTSLFQ
jgi:hypothetical protein